MPDEVEGGKDATPLVVGDVGLDERGEADVAGRGAEPVADERPEGRGQDADRGEGDIDQAAQTERAEHDGRVARPAGSRESTRGPTKAPTPIAARARP